ncbi:Fms-interacting protein-domain-containing protein, partial [Cladochytrium replicatum]
MDPLNLSNQLRQTVSTLVTRAEQGSFSDASHEEGIVPASFNNAATALFLELTELNRSLHLHSKAVKQDTHDAKQTMDRAQLELQNLNYERLYLQREIEKCDELETIYQDIDRMTDEEFMRRAPPEYIAAATDEHNMLLSQLRFEMSERLRLQTAEKELEGQRNQLTAEMKEKAAELESIDKELEQLLKYTVPLQDKLKLPVTAQHTTNELAALLPRPLFVLYQTAYGFSTAFEGTISVSIEGDHNAALEFFEQSTERKNDDPMETDAGDDDKEEYQTHGHHKGNEVAFERHPLKLVVSIPSTAKLMCSYLPGMDIVVASSELLEPIELVRPSFLLAALFPADFGLTCPNPSNEHFQRDIDVQKAGGSAYNWLQALCGYEFPVAAPPSGAISTKWYFESRMGKEKGSQEIDPSFTTGRGTYLAHVIELVRARHAALKEFGSVLSSLKTGMLALPDVDPFNKFPTLSKFDEKQDQTADQLSYMVGFVWKGIQYEVSLAISAGYPDEIPRFQIVDSTGLRLDVVEKILENPLQIIGQFENAEKKSIFGYQLLALLKGLDHQQQKSSL